MNNRSEHYCDTEEKHTEECQIKKAGEGGWGVDDGLNQCDMPIYHVCVRLLLQWRQGTKTV